MKRNILLLLAMLAGIIFTVNSVRRIMTFRETSLKVKESEERLEELKRENETLKEELEYKTSDEFAEEEIRNKLGLAKEGETIVVLPKEGVNKKQEAKGEKQKANWQKWWELFFES